MYSLLLSALLELELHITSNFDTLTVLCTYQSVPIPYSQTPTHKILPGHLAVVCWGVLESEGRLVAKLRIACLGLYEDLGKMLQNSPQISTVS